MAGAAKVSAYVQRTLDLAEGIRSWELRPANGNALPSFTAGAHVDLHLPNGLVRSYSLCNDPREADRYVIAVSKAATSRGGSSYMFDSLHAGDQVAVSGPMNTFKLEESSRLSVFVAGGIGITPIYSMILRLRSLGAPWRLHYSARTRGVCAFLEELSAFEREAPGRVFFNFDQEPGCRPTDLQALLAELPLHAHVYCCGPRTMLDAFERSAGAARLLARNVHVEHFSGREQACTDGGFTVELAQTGLSAFVSRGNTILTVLQQHGVDVAYSCMEGTCGSCETRVIEGVPVHRDSILSEEERASNRTMMICCSGCSSPRLVLDL